MLFYHKYEKQKKMTENMTENNKRKLSLRDL